MISCQLETLKASWEEHFQPIHGANVEVCWILWDNLLCLFLRTTLPLQEVEESVCKAEAHFSAALKWRGSRAAPAVPVYHQREEQKAQGLHWLSSLRLPSILSSLLPTTDFFSRQKCMSHSATPTQILFLFCFCLVFCLLTFIFRPPCFPLLSLCLFLYSSLSHLSPPLPCLCHTYCLMLPHFVLFCYSSMSDHWHRNGTWGSADPRWYSPVVHVKAAVFPISPRVPVPLLSVLAFCYAHSSAATMSSSPAAPLASLAHPVERFSGLL